MKEKLRVSLDTALMYQKLVDTFRDVVEMEFVGNPNANIEGKKDILNDELSLLMLSAFNGLGTTKIRLADVIELINERMSWMGDGDGIEKLMQPNFFNDGKEEFGYDEPPQDEWHQSDASDEDELRDEWDIEEDDDYDSTPEY